MSREALWLEIQQAKTVEAWKNLTGDFNLYRIYDLFRILKTPKECETLRCGIVRWFTLSLEAHQQQDEQRYYMAYNDGNVRECYSPEHFNALITDIMKDALSRDNGEEMDSDNISDEVSETDSVEEIPLCVQYAFFEALLTYCKAGPATNDRSKIINLFSAFTGRGYRAARNMAYKGVTVSPRFQNKIDELNKCFADLGINIVLKTTRKS